MDRLTVNTQTAIILKMATFEELQERFELAERNARALPTRTRRDCVRMGDHVRDLFQAASRAAVECRRLRRVTPRYEQCLAAVEESLQNFEGYVIMAKLMKGYS
jgi:hypothetical protein